MLLIILLGIFAFFSILDVVTSVYVIEVLGGEELNPVLNGLSSFELMLVKLGGVSVVCFLVFVLKAYKLAVFACVATLGVVVWNFLQIGGF